MRKEKYIVKHLAGSHAYGTNIATSDTDYRGIFMAEKKFILTPFFNIKEINDTTEEDTKFYELNNYLSLYLDGNPNILETLWVEPNDILYSTEEYDLLRSNNKNLLSSKVAFTYSGYAHSQKTRMKNHYSWMDKERNGIKCLEELILQYPCIQMKDWICESFPDYIYNKLDFSSCNKYIKTIIDFDKFMRNTSLQLISTLDLKQYYFIKLVHNYFDHQVLERDFNIMNYNSGYELLPYGKDIYAVVKNENGKCINNDGSIHKMDTSNLSIDEIKQKPCLIVKYNSEEFDASNNNKKSYHSWKQNRNPIRGEQEQINGYDCYQNSTTEFLTKTGFKKYDEITSTDLLGTFDIDGNIEWQHYNDRIKKNYSGILYTLETENTKTVVTENHRMYISKYNRNNKSINKFNFIEMKKAPKEFVQLNSINNNFADNEKYSDSFLVLIGSYVSEGSLLKSSTGKLKGITISQLKNGRQEHYYNIIAKEYNIKINEYTRNNKIELTVNIYNKELAAQLKQMCGEYSHYKKLPEFITELSKRQARLLLDVMIAGDGSNRKYSMIYHTSSTQLANDTYVLSTVAGYISKIWDYKEKHGMYQIYISDKKSMDITYTRNHLKQQEVIDEEVVCFTVPNSTLITRNGKKSGFHGNCKHAMHTVRLLIQCEELLTTGNLIVKRPDAQMLLDIREGNGHTMK